MKTSRIECSLCSKPPSDRLLKVLCRSHPRFLVCNECLEFNKATQCLQCLKTKAFHEEKGEQKINKQLGNYGGNKISYNCYDLPKGDIDQLYLAQIEINKNLAQAKLMSKELELKKLKEQFDQMTLKLEDHKQTILAKLKQEKLVQIEEYKQRLQRDYLQKEERMKIEIEEQKASLKRQEERLLNEHQLLQSLIKVEHEKNIKEINIAMSDQRAQFKEEYMRLGNQLEQEKKRIQIMIERHQKQMIQFSQQSRRERQQQIQKMQKEKRKALEEAETEKRRMGDQYEQILTKMKAQLSARIYDVEEKAKAREQILEKQKEKLLQQKEQLLRSKEEQLAQLSSYQLKIEQKNMQISRISDRQTETSKINMQLSRMRDNLAQRQNKVKNFNQSIETTINYMKILTTNIGEIFSEVGSNYQICSPQRAKLLKVFINQYNKIQSYAINKEVDAILINNQLQIDNFAGKESERMIKLLKEVNIKDWIQNHAYRLKFLERFRSRLDLFKEIRNSVIQQLAENQVEPQFKATTLDYLVLLRDRLNKLNNEPIKFELIDQIHHFQQTKKLLLDQFQNHGCLKGIQGEIDYFLQWLRQRIQYFSLRTLQSQPEQELQRIQENKLVLKLIQNGALKNNFVLKTQIFFAENYQSIYHNFLIGIKNKKQELQQKLGQLAKNRIYQQSYAMEKVFRRYKSFDEIIGKNDANFHNISFSELYVKYVTFFKALKEQKMSLSINLISNDKINLAGLKKQLQSVQFDEQIRIKFVYRVVKIMLNRISRVQMIGVKEEIKLKEIKMIEEYKRELSQLKKIEKLSNIEEIELLQHLIDDKMKLVYTYLIKNYEEIYSKIMIFDHLSKMKEQSLSQAPIQNFLSTFPVKYAQFNQSIYAKLHIPRQQTVSSYFYQYLNAIADKQQEKVFQIANSQEQVLQKEHVKLFQNIFYNLDEEAQLKLEAKLTKTINDQIFQLEFKESKGVIAPDEQQIEIMNQIKHLPERHITNFRQQIDLRRKFLSEQKLKIIEKQKKKFALNNFQTLKDLYSNYEIKKSINDQSWRKYGDLLQSFIQQSYRYSIGNARNQEHFLNNLYNIEKGAYCEMIQFMKSKEFGIYFMHIGLTSNQRLMNLLESVQNIEDYNYTAIQNTLSQINHIFQLGKILQQNHSKSLLQKAEISQFRRIITFGKQKIIENVYKLQNLKNIHIFQYKTDKELLQELFTGLIKIQIYKRIFSSISQQPECAQLFLIEEDITQAINNDLKEGIREISKFKFGVSDEGSEQRLKKGLQDASSIFGRFRQLEQLIKHLSDYMKQGYLNQLNLKQAKTSQIASKLQSTWQKQYSKLKSDINRQLHHKSTSVNLFTTMKSMQIQKQLVESNHINCFKFLLEERFNFDRQGMSQLKEEQDKLQSNLYRLAEKRHLFLNGLETMQRAGQQRKKIEKEKLISKYSTLMNEVRNSFHEMASQQARQKRISMQIQTLRNQQSSEIQNTIEEESKLLQEKKLRHLVNIQNPIINILESLAIVAKINHIFGPLVQERAAIVLNRVSKDVSNFDKGLLQQIKKHASQIQFRYQMLKISKQQQHQLTSSAAEQDPLNTIQSFIQRIRSIGRDQIPLRQACGDFKRQFERIKNFVGFEYSQKVILQIVKDTKNQIKNLSAPIVLARIHCIFEMFLQRLVNERNDLQLPSSDQIVTIILLVNGYNGDSSKQDNTLIDVASVHNSSKMLAYCNIYLALKGYNVYCGNSSMNLSQKLRQQYEQIFSYFSVDSMIIYGQYQSAYKYFLSDGQNLQLESVIKKMIIKTKLSALQQKFICSISKKIEQKKQSTIFIISDIQQFYDIFFLQGCYYPQIRLDIAEFQRVFELIWKKRNSQTLKDDIFKSVEVILLKEKYADLWRLLVNHIQAMINSARKVKELEQLKMSRIQLESKFKWKRTQEGYYFNAFSACNKYEKGLISEQAFRKILFVPLKLGQLPNLQISSFFCNMLGISSGLDKLPPIYTKIIKQKHLMTKLYQIVDLKDNSEIDDIPFKSVEKEQFSEFIIDKMLALKSANKSVVVLFDSEQEIDQIHYFKDKIQSQMTNICKINQSTLFQNMVVSIERLYRESSIILINSKMLKTLFSLLPKQQTTTIELHIICTSIPKNQPEMVFLRDHSKDNIFCELIISKQKLSQRDIFVEEDDDFYPNLHRFWTRKIEQFQQNCGLKMRTSKQKMENMMKMLGYLEKDAGKFIDAVTKINLVELDNENNKLIIAVQASPLMSNALNALIKLLKDEILHGVHFTVKILVFRNYHCKYDMMFESSNFSRAFDYLKNYIQSIKLEEYYQQSSYEGLLYEIGKICEYEKIRSLIIIGEGLGNSKDDMIRLRSKYYGEKYWASKLPFLENLQCYGKPLLQNHFSISFLEIVNNKQTDEGEKEDTVKSLQTLIEQSYGNYFKINSDGFEDVFNLKSLREILSSSVLPRRE